jgi:DNA-binding XRE family transcriptional regulator
MKTETNLEKLKKITSKQQSGWLEDAKWREGNEAWLDYSFKIALRVLNTLRSLPITQRDLAEKMGVTPQHVNKIVKGKENLSLETIAKLEKALGVPIISIFSGQSGIKSSYALERDYEISEVSENKPTKK